MRRLELGGLSLIALALACACAPAADDADANVANDITLTALHPAALVPGSRIVLAGSSFVPDFAGPSRLELRGELDGAAVAISLPATFIDYDRLELSWPGGPAAGMAERGSFHGSATVSAASALDGLEHRSAALPLSLELAPELTPRLDSLQNEAIFVNDPVVAHGGGFLLGGDEGATVAVVAGCFTPAGGGACKPVGPVEVPAAPFEPFDRARALFPFAPSIAGIKPGSFQGTVKLVNHHGGGAVRESQALATKNDIVPPAIVSFAPASASLGQYVDVHGGGFVGSPGVSANATRIALDGTFTAEGKAPVKASLTLLPQFVSGQLVRYVVSEDDELGKSVDLRQVAGSFSGGAKPIVTFGADEVEGSTTKVSLGIDHVRQVVWIRFLPTYVESLRHFGLRAADGAVRARILEVLRRDYSGVNVDFREAQPADFALFSRVDVGGPDPNGLGLLGYDNSPGKDGGNLRLYDVIGGVNAVTQQDGASGYGGVFVDSLFAFSAHPGGFAKPVGGADAAFDQLFDPFRPDSGGEPVRVAELSGLPAVDGSACPAGGRATQVACAIRALGSLVGTTVSHELAHALGLADPGGPAFHNSQDWPNEIMDSGDARPFRERAEVMGQGPAIFCARNYGYLRGILPSKTPDPLPTRDDCY